MLTSFGFLSAFFFLNTETMDISPGSQDNKMEWWKHAVFYQVYPRSFKDSNNDGIGDLRGIIEKMDHFSDAGVDAIWLSPVFKSPQVDQGYDISDYTDIDPAYGTIEDLDELVDKAHSINIKVILDFVPNHTSDQHPWFVDSVHGVEKFKDFYVWVDAKIDSDGNRKPPNNWISVFGNSSWTWSEERHQYYLHQFASAQPDLNYRNPAVVEAMKDILKFWLDRGVDGFRVDAVPYIFEEAEFLDEPLSDSPVAGPEDTGFLDHIYTKDQPETYELIYQWRKFLDDYTQEKGGPERILMTEAYTDIEHTMLYFGTSDGRKLGAHFTFNFNLITDIDKNSTADDIVDAIKDWLDAIPPIYTSNWVIGNHDNPRTATRFGPQNVDGFNMLVAFLPGIGVYYNGEEIGQENGEVDYEEGKDPSARNPKTFDKVSRDFERTPFQWDDSVNAGFNDGAKPWLPVSEKYTQIHLKKQKETEGNSHYKIFQESLMIRKQEPFITGSTEIEAIDSKVVLVKRTCGDSYAVLLFNFSDDEAVINASNFITENNSIILASANSKIDKGSTLNPAAIAMGPHESCLIKLEQ